MTTVNEPFTFGQGTLKNLGQKQKHVREFIGSETYDVIAKSGMERATPDQWIGFLRNARQKGVKPEELADAGLLSFNNNFYSAHNAFNTAESVERTNARVIENLIKGLK